jgi:hypothetical protein
MDYKQHKGNLRGKIKDKVERKLYNKQIRAVEKNVDTSEGQLTIPDVVGLSEQLVCDLCNEDGWIVENKGDVIERRLCKCDKSN